MYLILEGADFSANKVGTVPIKTVDEISQQTIDLLAYYGGTYTDDEKIALDDYLELNTNDSIYAKLVHLQLPFLAPNMTAGEIEADLATGNKAFYDIKQAKLPDGTKVGYQNGFTSGRVKWALTDKGITEVEIPSSGTTYALATSFSDDVLDVNNFSLGVCQENIYGLQLASYNLYTHSTAHELRNGASTQVNSWTKPDDGTRENPLMMLSRADLQANCAACIGDNDLTQTAFSATNYDTDVLFFQHFDDNVDFIGKSFSFLFVSELLTPAELRTFYDRTRTLLTAFGVI